MCAHVPAAVLTSTTAFPHCALQGVIDAAPLSADSSVDLSDSATAPSGSAPAAAAGAKKKGGTVDLGRIETLRREQARLRQEYEDMESNLGEMERSMREREIRASEDKKGGSNGGPGGSSGAAGAAAKEGGRDVVFKFLQQPLDGSVDHQVQEVNSHSKNGSGKQ